MASVLRNPRHEIFAQCIAAGLSSKEAYQKAGYTGKYQHLYSRVNNLPHIRQRVKDLLAASARRAELSRKDILDRIFQDWELARKLGQVPAALKAAELMGREIHKMFTERKEIGGPGDFDNKSEEELRTIVKEGLKDLGWEDDVIIPPNPSTIN